MHGVIIIPGRTVMYFVAAGGPKVGEAVIAALNAVAST